MRLEEGDVVVRLSRSFLQVTCMYESHVIVSWPVTCMTLCMFSRWVLAPVTRSSSGSVKPNHNWWDTSLSTQWTPNLSWHYYGNDITVHYHGNNVWDNTWATLQDLATRSTSADRNTESRKLSPYVVCSHGLKPGMEETSYVAAYSTQNGVWATKR